MTLGVVKASTYIKAWIIRSAVDTIPLQTDWVRQAWGVLPICQRVEI